MAVSLSEGSRMSSVLCTSHQDFLQHPFGHRTHFPEGESATNLQASLHQLRANKDKWHRGLCLWGERNGFVEQSAAIEQLPLKLKRAAENVVFLMSTAPTIRRRERC